MMLPLLSVVTVTYPCPVHSTILLYPIPKLASRVSDTLGANTHTHRAAMMIVFLITCRLCVREIVWRELTDTVFGWDLNYSYGERMLSQIYKWTKQKYDLLKEGYWDTNILVWLQWKYQQENQSGYVVWVNLPWLRQLRMDAGTVWNLQCHCSV